MGAWRADGRCRTSPRRRYRRTPRRAPRTRFGRTRGRCRGPYRSTRLQPWLATTFVPTSLNHGGTRTLAPRRGDRPSPRSRRLRRPCILRRPSISVQLDEHLDEETKRAYVVTANGDQKWRPDAPLDRSRAEAPDVADYWQRPRSVDTVQFTHVVGASLTPTTDRWLAGRSAECGGGSRDPGRRDEDTAGASEGAAADAGAGGSAASGTG